MTTIGATELRKNCFKMLNSCLKYKEPINVRTKRGNVVMMTEEEFRGWKATVELCSIPGMKKKILEGKNTPISKCQEW